MNKLMIFLGLAPDNNEMEMVKKIRDSYSSLEVVGRGTVRISAKEIRQDPAFKKLSVRAQRIVESSQE
ncbi:Uncharacterised protein [Campylobacter jejuni]|nr:Uncharacterised protein [Campylobacter jejuni]